MTDEPPAECLDWQGKKWTPEIARDDRRESRASERALHRARLAMPDHRSGLGRPERRADQRASFSAGAARQRMPLVYQAFNWSAGVYIGATMGSEMTAAAAGTIGKVRRDPDGHAAVLRLSHGRLLPPLDQDAALDSARRRASST